MTGRAAGRSEAEIAVLRRIERRLLWLATSMVHHANHVRADGGGLKIGGHQASSASSATIMTALWFDALRAADRVSVKPTASPVLYAIGHLLGQVDKADLESLRAFGGLQAYPSRTKNAFVDYSTGSMGLGANSALWDALTRRYLADHFGHRAQGRHFALVGDAELDEGAVWEAVLDPMVGRLGEVTWVVDVNRQALDRPLPTASAQRAVKLFEAAGWRVLELRYGQRLEALFLEPGGEELRAQLDRMTSQEYARLLQLSGRELRDALNVGRAPWAAPSRLIDSLDAATLAAAVRNLGGHDLPTLLDAFADTGGDCPTIVFAHTIKGYGLPFEGHPDNHGALLSPDQYREFAEHTGHDPHSPWEPFAEGSEEELLCRQTALRLRRPEVRLPSVLPPVPADLGHIPTGSVSTQAAFGSVLLDLKRSAPEVADRIVTVSPDVSTTTNLGGWINRAALWEADGQAGTGGEEPPDGGLVKWRPSRSGQHIQLGIAETNLVGLIGELGMSWSRWGEPLLPIGTLYDPFVTRALEPWSFALYGGSRSILVGTPSGVALAPEGGAHQSVITPSVGLEQPGCVAYEPAFASDLQWCLLAALDGLVKPRGQSAYFRLSTRRIDQAQAVVPTDPDGREARRRQAVAGGYRLRTAVVPCATVVAMGATVPEALMAADRLAQDGFDVDVVCVTSADLLYRAVRERAGYGAGTGDGPGQDWILSEVLPAERAMPMVTVLDGHPHTLAFLATVHQVPVTSLGVTAFGQSGSIDDVFRHYGIDDDAIASAVLDLVE